MCSGIKFSKQTKSDFHIFIVSYLNKHIHLLTLSSILPSEYEIIGFIAKQFYSSCYNIKFLQQLSNNENEIQ